MSTLHKADIREAGPMNSFVYQKSPKTPIHLPGDKAVRGNQPVRPSDCPPVVGLVVTDAEVAAVENIRCLEDLRKREAHRFGAGVYQTYKPPASFYKQGVERPDRPRNRGRPFTPDSRRMASVVNLQTLTEADEFFAEAMANLEARWAANPGTTFYQRLAEEPDEAAAAPPGRRRTAAGVIDFGELVQA